MYHSQAGQDEWVVHTLGWKRDGYFVEVGAYDGLSTSNTLMLERQLGWRGLCVEANPDLEAALRANRSCAVVPCAASNGLGAVQFEGDRVLVSGGRTVASVTLTAMLTTVEAPDYIDYLSIDVEGHEVEVLEGWDHLRFPAGLLTIEHNLYLNGPALKQAIAEVMFARGYERVAEDVVAPGYGPYEDWWADRKLASRAAYSA